MHIRLLLLLISASAGAQEFISADVTGGCDSLEVTFTLENAYNLDQYNSVEWFFGDGATEQNTLIADHVYSNPGRYAVRCRLDGFRMVLLQDTIVVSETPVADFTFKDTVVNGGGYEYIFESRYFSPFEGVKITYNWEFPDGTISILDRPVFSFESEGIYHVRMVMTDENGCSDTITKRIPVADELLVPNNFTPNDDGINDYFRVTTPGDYIYIFRIFSREGLQLHYSRSPEIFWDGRGPDGTIVDEGIYYYIIESVDAPAKISQRGFIQIFR